MRKRILGCSSGYYLAWFYGIMQDKNCREWEKRKSSLSKEITVLEAKLFALKEKQNSKVQVIG